MLGERLSTCLRSRLAANLTALLGEGRGREGGGGGEGGGGNEPVWLLTSPSDCLLQHTLLAPGRLVHLGVGQGRGIVQPHPANSCCSE